MVQSINFTVLGRSDIAAELGKKGLVSDMTFYDHSAADIIRTWVVPNEFPNKIQPLFQAIGLGEYIVFDVATLDRFVGEQILALDALDKDRGILLHTFDVDESRLDSLIKGTVVDRYDRVDHNDIRQAIDKFEQITIPGDTEIIVDHALDVKGVGTVVLGKVMSGIVHQYDTLKLYPQDVEILVKSIQMHDAPVTESVCPARVGLAIKGVSSDDIRRGDILSSIPHDIYSEIHLDFEQSRFYKGSLAVNQGYLLSVGLQIRAVKIISVDPLHLSLDRPIVSEHGQRAVLLKPESQIRIVGHGQVC